MAPPPCPAATTLLFPLLPWRLACPGQTEKILFVLSHLETCYGYAIILVHVSDEVACVFLCNHRCVLQVS